MDFFFFFIKKKKAYEMRISGWSSDVCSSDLETGLANNGGLPNAQPDGHTPAWGSPQQRPPSLGDNRGYFAPQRQTAFRLNDHQPGRAGDWQALYRPLQQQPTQPTANRPAESATAGDEFTLDMALGQLHG